MKKVVTEKARLFAKWINTLVTERGYVLLHRKDHERADTVRLLGFYDSRGVYIIPDKLFGMAAEFMSTHRTDIKDVERNLFISDMIKIEDDGMKIRYRRQKRIGKTKKRYLTFYPSAIFSAEEQKIFIPQRQ